MFGLLAARPVAMHELLHDAPRSLRTLSREHADGWGIAFSRADDWSIQRSTSCAARCAGFDALRDVTSQLVIAHVRRKTVGELALANTHPFRRGQFVFAHNGTIHAFAALVAQTAPAHLAMLEGDTDSERLFAFVLTKIDEQGDVARGVTEAIRVLRTIDQLGEANFLLSCGTRLYAYRHGRTLYTLQRAEAQLVASEPLTDEPWQEVPERELVVLEAPSPALRAA